MAQDICWCNSENFTIGDPIKVRGKIGTVTEKIHQYLHTDIPGIGWINPENTTTVRGIPKTCHRCKYSLGYSGGQYFCDMHKTKNHDQNDTCDQWNYV